MLAPAPTPTPTTSYDLTVQTVFTPPPDCSEQEVLTLTAGPPTLVINGTTYSNTEPWYHPITPREGITITSCYPSQFWSSALASTSLPPFQQLICPAGWETYDLNSTYRVCCPGGYEYFQPFINTNPDRPAEDAACTSAMWPGIEYEQDSWDDAGRQVVAYLTVGNGTDSIDGLVALATLFDGIVATTTLTTPNTTTASAVSISVYPAIAPSTGVPATTTLSSQSPTATSTTQRSSANHKLSSRHGMVAALLIGFCLTI